jgi:hypothetical protein
VGRLFIQRPESCALVVCTGGGCAHAIVATSLLSLKFEQEGRERRLRSNLF